MYQKDSKVVYGQTGVCIIEDITEKELIKNQKRLYYVLKPLYQQNNTIYAPVDSEKVAIRPILTAEEANKLICDIPQIAQKAKSENAAENGKISFTNNCSDLVQIATKIYQKKQNAKLQKKKLGSMDEKYMRQAEGLLYGELSAALGIPLEEVPSYIEQTLKEI